MSSIVYELIVMVHRCEISNIRPCSDGAWFKSLEMSFIISPIMLEPFPNIPIFLVIGKQLLVVRTIPCIKVLVMIEFND